MKRLKAMRKADFNRHSDEALAEEESGNKKQNNENAAPVQSITLMRPLPKKSLVTMKFRCLFNQILLPRTSESE